MYLFDKRFVHFMWNPALKGKRGFLSSGIDTLIKMVNEDSDRTEIQKGCERDLPFCKHITVECRLAYYDPNYSVKWAYYKEGKKIQVTPKGTDKWVDLHCEPKWDIELEYRVKPDCPCTDGIDSKACAGCPQDEERKQTVRPFKDCDELVEFWSKNYQTGLRPKNTKPLIWVRLKVDGRERLIVAFGKGFGTDFVEIGNKAKAVTLQKLFEDYEFLDGAVCGVKND